MDTPLHRHAHRHDEHDLDEYEEETLQAQIRSGELGEMLQEAHLDHRIQLELRRQSRRRRRRRRRSTEDEEETAPRRAILLGNGQAKQRRDAGDRGRRGRGSREPRFSPGRSSVDHRAARRKAPTCPSFPTCSSRVRKSWSRSPRSPSPRRAHASPATSLCPAASWSSCPR